MFYPDWSYASNVIVVLTIISGSAALVMQEYLPDSRMGYSKFNIKSDNNVSSQYMRFVLLGTYCILDSLLLWHAHHLCSFFCYLWLYFVIPI